MTFLVKHWRKIKIHLNKKSDIGLEVKWASYDINRRWMACVSNKMLESMFVGKFIQVSWWYTTRNLFKVLSYRRYRRNKCVLFSGVTSLRVLLAHEKDEDSPKLNILLTECLFAVYVSLVINALATYDCFLLYRLTAHQFSTKLWSSLFGGGVKTVIRLGSTSPKLGSQYNLFMICYMKFWIN